jgi:hypothetical protein
MKSILFLVDMSTAFFYRRKLPDCKSTKNQAFSAIILTLVEREVAKEAEIQ